MLYICTNNNKQIYNIMTTTNYPEMHGTTEANVQVRYSSIIKKFVVTAKNEIETKRGIEFVEVVSATGANNVPNKRAGWFKYYMTPKAFDKFEADSKEDITLNILLD